MTSNHPEYHPYTETKQGIRRRRLKIAGMILGAVMILSVPMGIIMGVLWAGGIFSESSPQTIPFSTSELLASPPSSNYAPSSLNEQFMVRYGHKYYSPIQPRQPEVEIQKILGDLEELLGGIEEQLQFSQKYEEGYFDCSEMSSYIEYFLERHGYQASTFTNSDHAWVMVYSTGGWMPIEATTLFMPTHANNEGYSIYSEPENRYDSIGEYFNGPSSNFGVEYRERLDYLDWWETRYADELEEVAQSVNEPIDIDSDQDDDGLTTREEKQWETDPLDPDSDGDGLNDGDEIKKFATNPLDPDSDSDGLNDGNEINLATDPLDSDSDSDGLNDGDEINLATDPLDPDSDSDGLNDGNEIKLATNPLKQDTDNDGVIDVDDFFPLRDAQIKVDIIYFEEKVGADDPLPPGEPYFIMDIGGVKQESQRPCFSATYKDNPYSTVVDVSDNQEYVDVLIEVWDYDDGWDPDDQYDASSSPDSLAYMTTYDVLDGEFSEISDGTWDRSLQGPQCQIIVKISMI